MEQEVRRLVRKTIEEGDLSKITNRIVVDNVCSALDLDKNEWRKFIKGQVEAFLTEEPEDNPNKRAAEDDVAGASKRAKTSIVGKLLHGQEGNWEIQLAEDGSCRIEIKKFNSALFVDIRRLLVKEDGSMMPTKKGIALRVPEWRTLAAVKEQVTSAARTVDTEFKYDLTEVRKVRVQQFRGKTQIDIREFYIKDGIDAPGYKGVALSLDEWEALSDAADSVEMALDRLGAPSHSQGATNGAASKKQAASKSATVPPHMDPDQPVALPEGLHHLGRDRYARIDSFKGTRYLHVREYYKADGAELKPTKKGITLNYGQMYALRDALPNLLTSLDSKEETNPIELGKMKKAAVKEFKKKYYLDLREFYDKGREELPGKKGVTLSSEEATQLNNLAESFVNQLMG